MTDYLARYGRFRLFLPIVLAVLILPALLSCRSAPSESDACRGLAPLASRSTVPYGNLASQIDRIRSAPRDSHFTLHLEERELESYLGEEILPLLGLSGSGVRVRFQPGLATIQLRSSDGSPTMTAILLGPGPGAPAPLRVSCLSLGGLDTPAPVTRTLDRVLSESLRSDDLGVRVTSVVLADGEAYLTLSRR